MICDRFSAAFALAVTASTVVACDDDDEWRTVVVENSGPVCLTSENGSLNARVSVDACLVGGCRRELATACQANVSADRITSGRLHAIDPQQYLDEILRVLLVLPYWPKERYVELAPKYWKATRAKVRASELAAPMGAFTIPPA